ncbi:MAG: hypothetical protein AAGC47_10630, partial [Bacteroidota bacterium]
LVYRRFNWMTYEAFFHHTPVERIVEVLQKRVSYDLPSNIDSGFSVKTKRTSYLKGKGGVALVHFTLVYEISKQERFWKLKIKQSRMPFIMLFIVSLMLMLVLGYFAFRNVLLGLFFVPLALPLFFAEYTRISNRFDEHCEGLREEILNV